MAFLSKDDSINYAMTSGLKNAFKDELKGVLREVAEKEIESIAERVSERIKINSKTWQDFYTEDRKIKLEWIITHKEPE